MANQTLLLDVSDEMKLYDERQNCVGMESGEELCSSSSDTTEELYSSSEPDTYRSCDLPGAKDIMSATNEITHPK